LSPSRNTLIYQVKAFLAYSLPQIGQEAVMMTSPDSHARHVLAQYAKDFPGATAELGLLQKLIADEIQKAVSEDRETLREKMACERRTPCGFNAVCANHRALAGAILATQLSER
jgi:hypothetical protein